MMQHRDDGNCHRGCFERAVMGDSEYEFIRRCYLDIADEFDPVGEGEGMPTPRLSDFDDDYIKASREFARLMGIPLPWELRSIDLAAAAVERAERKDTF